MPLTLLVLPSQRPFYCQEINKFREISHRMIADKKLKHAIFTQPEVFQFFRPNSITVLVSFVLRTAA